MCASARNVTIPTPPHPNPMTCVAPTMCASARNMMLRSNDHVCKCKERYHPHPTPPQDSPRGTSDKVLWKHPRSNHNQHPHVHFTKQFQVDCIGEFSGIERLLVYPGYIPLFWDTPQFTSETNHQDGINTHKTEHLKRYTFSDTNPEDDGGPFSGESS